MNHKTLKNSASRRWLSYFENIIEIYSKVMELKLGMVCLQIISVCNYEYLMLRSR